MRAKYRRILCLLGVITIVGLIIGNTELFYNTTTAKDRSHQTSNKNSEVEAKAEYTATKEEVEDIEFETKTVDDNTIEYGQAIVKTEGVRGEKTFIYDITYKGDKEISRKLIKEEVTKQPIARIIARGIRVVWHCVDATSYNKNPYDDNRCTNSTGEVRYVSDSQSRILDPSYTPGKAGHYWYNSR
jgi:3D domain protein